MKTIREKTIITVTVTTTIIVFMFSKLGMDNLYAQENSLPNPQQYIQKWEQEQSKKQFNKDNYEIGGLGSRTCPDVEDKHGIIFVKYPTADPIYEPGCTGQVGFYKITGYEVISVDESDITGITTVKLSK